MEKVFLVEDEVVVREGIKNNIDWAANGYEFCGEARDGELAFPLIQKTKPDIVITDIKMPFMDGLALSSLIKKELPETEIIILTGYEEFEYAKKGIQIGVSKYLTKPISGEDLLKEVNAVAEKIRQRKEDSDLLAKYQQEMEENSRKEQTGLFLSLVSGKCSMTELMELADKNEIDITAVWYNIILLKAKSKKHKEEEYSGSYVKLEQRLINLCDEKDVLVFERNLDGKALLLKADSKEELDEKQTELLDKIKELLADYPNIDYFGGIGNAVNRMTEISVSFESASRAFAHRYFEEQNRFVDASVETIARSSGDEEVNLHQIDMTRVSKGRIDEFLRTASHDEIGYFVDEFASTTGNGFLESLMFRQYIVMDVYFSVVTFVESLSHSREELEELDANSSLMRSADESMKFIQKLLTQAIDIRDASASNRYGEIIDKAVEYIQDNYGDEELSLNSLASFVNVSPNHLSMIFSQQTGQTFIKYLTEYRMTKAKELLRCTGKRSSEIAEEVGYHDPHYFSYLFKKTQGMTPTQYRGVNEG